MATSIYNPYLAYSVNPTPSLNETQKLLDTVAKEFVRIYSSFSNEDDNLEDNLFVSLMSFSYFLPDSIQKTFNMMALEYLENKDYQSNSILCIKTKRPLPVNILDIDAYELSLFTSYNRIPLQSLCTIVSQLQCWVLQIYSSFNTTEILSFVIKPTNQFYIANTVLELLNSHVNDYDCSYSMTPYLNRVNEILDYVDNRASQQRMKYEREEGVRYEPKASSVTSTPSDNHQYTTSKSNTTYTYTSSALDQIQAKQKEAQRQREFEREQQSKIVDFRVVAGAILLVIWLITSL